MRRMKKEMGESFRNQEVARVVEGERGICWCLGEAGRRR